MMLDNVAVALVDDADTADRHPSVGLLLKRVAVVGSGTVKIHQIGLHLVKQDGG